MKELKRGAKLTVLLFFISCCAAIVDEPQSDSTLPHTVADVAKCRKLFEKSLQLGFPENLSEHIDEGRNKKIEQFANFRLLCTLPRYLLSVINDDAARVGDTATALAYLASYGKLKYQIPKKDLLNAVSVTPGVHAQIAHGLLLHPTALRMITKETDRPEKAVLSRQNADADFTRMLQEMGKRVSNDGQEDYVEYLTKLQQLTKSPEFIKQVGLPMPSDYSEEPFEMNSAECSMRAPASRSSSQCSVPPLRRSMSYHDWTYDQIFIAEPDNSGDTLPRRAIDAEPSAVEDYDGVLQSETYNLDPKFFEGYVDDLHAAHDELPGPLRKSTVNDFPQLYLRGSIDQRSLKKNPIYRDIMIVGESQKLLSALLRYDDHIVKEQLAKDFKQQLNLFYRGKATGDCSTVTVNVANLISKAKKSENKQFADIMREAEESLHQAILRIIDGHDLVEIRSGDAPLPDFMVPMLMISQVWRSLVRYEDGTFDAEQAKLLEAIANRVSMWLSLPEMMNELGNGESTRLGLLPLVATLLYAYQDDNSEYIPPVLKNFAKASEICFIHEDCGERKVEMIGELWAHPEWINHAYYLNAFNGNELNDLIVKLPAGIQPQVLRRTDTMTSEYFNHLLKRMLDDALLSSQVKANAGTSTMEIELHDFGKLYEVLSEYGHGKKQLHLRGVIMDVDDFRNIVQLLLQRPASNEEQILAETPHNMIKRLDRMLKVGLGSHTEG